MKSFKKTKTQIMSPECSITKSQVLLVVVEFFNFVEF